MISPEQVSELLRKGAELEEIAAAVGIEYREGELTVTFGRRVSMALHAVAFRYQSLIDDVDLQVEYRRSKERERHQINV